MSLTRDQARGIAQAYVESTGSRNGGARVRHVLRYGEIWFSVRALGDFPLARLDTCWIAYVDCSDHGTPISELVLIDQDSGEIVFTVGVDDQH